MNILIFSDTHLSTRFEKKKAEFLIRLIKRYDQVIIGGDFWEGELITFSQFINSEWKVLFPLLKKKNAIYLYGNHDPEKLCDTRASLFSVKQNRQYTFTSNDKVFIVEHGDRVDSFIVRLFTSRYGKYFSTRYLGKYIDSEGIIIKLFGIKAFTKLCSLFNKKIKEKVSKEFTNNEFFICGHTHAQELTNRFANTGIIHSGIAQYVTVKNGTTVIHQEKYN
jgi:predicted phosphodiesterase